MDFAELEKRSQEEMQRFMRRFINKLLKYWWFIGLTLTVFLASAFLYIRYTPEIYAVKAQIMLQDKTGDFDPSMLLFNNGRGKQDKQLANEIILIKSYPLLSKTISDLGYNVHYYRTTKALERIIEIEAEECPFRIDILNDTFSALGLGSKNNPFVVNDNGRSFELLSSDEKVMNSGVWGEQMEVNGLVLNLNQNGNVETIEEGVQYMFSVSPVDYAVRGVQAALNVAMTNEDASAIDIGISGQLIQREKRFVDQLLANYLKANLEEKNKGAANTIAFINRELSSIKDSLERIESRLKLFKSSNRISDLDKEGERIFDKLLELESEKAAVLLQKKYLDIIDDYFTNESGENLVTPSSFGIQDPSVNKITESLLQLESEKRLMGTGNEGSVRLRLSERIKELRESLANYTANLQEATDLKLQALNKRIDLIEGTIESLPSSEMALMNIQRLQKLSESLYLLLMEKKAEAEITKSSNTPDIRIVENARLAALRPISPNTTVIYAGALLFGLMIPVIILALFVYLDRTIRSKEEIVRQLDIPFIGYVVAAKGKAVNYLIEQPKSRLSESFRTIRSNLKFLKADKSIQTILVTSCLPGEGKTFVTANLAKSLAMAGKKVLVIGADLRKPQLHAYFDTNIQSGLSSLLTGQCELNEAIDTTNESVDVMLSGPIPPNPLELLDSKAFDNLLVEAKQRYDYVIIDTSPFVLVADAKVLLVKVDYSLVVLRSGVSKRTNADHIRDLIQGLPEYDLGLVLNDFEAKDAYGYGMTKGYTNGYGYYEEGGGQ